MEKFIAGQKVRVLTIEELLRKGYFLDGDGDIYVGDNDDFFVKPMCDYCNVKHKITASEDMKRLTPIITAGWILKQMFKL